MRKKWGMFILFPAGLLISGCSQEGTSGKVQPPSAQSSAAEKIEYLLDREPAGAKGVRAARTDAKNGEDLVIVGRIGGEKNPWVEGRAAFWVVDPSLKSCRDRQEDDCKTPWDYCCDDPSQLHKSMATIRIVDHAGKTVPQDARQLLGLKELQTVVAKGKVKRDEAGNLTVLASGVYVRP
jgi:hypothetical protein